MRNVAALVLLWTGWMDGLDSCGRCPGGRARRVRPYWMDHSTVFVSRQVSRKRWAEV